MLIATLFIQSATSLVGEWPKRHSLVPALERALVSRESLGPRYDPATALCWPHSLVHRAWEVLVVDDEVVTALTIILERTKYPTEPAASCRLAAAEEHRNRFVWANK